MKHNIQTALLIVVLLGLWQILAINEDIHKNFSSPYEVAKILFYEIQSKDFWKHVYFSYLNITIGYIIGNLLGIFVGIIFWLKASLGKIVNPILFILSSIPVFAIAPMSILWWGSGDIAKIIIVFLHVFFIASFYAYKIAGSVREEYYDYYKFVGINTVDLLIHIIIPSFYFWISHILKMTVGFAVLGEFVAEFIVSDVGLGHYIIKATGLYDVPRVLIGIIFLLLYSTGVSLILNYLQNKFLDKRFGIVRE